MESNGHGTILGVADLKSWSIYFPRFLRLKTQNSFMEITFDHSNRFYQEQPRASFKVVTLFMEVSERIYYIYF